MNSLLTLLTSRKTQRVILGIATILVTLWFSLPTLTTPAAKEGAVISALAGIAGLLGIDIYGIATEDAATKSAPSQQVNVGSDVKNTNAAPAAAQGAQPAAVDPPAPAAPKPAMVQVVRLDQLAPLLKAAVADAMAQQRQPPPPNPGAQA